MQFKLLFEEKFKPQRKLYLTFPFKLESHLPPKNCVICFIESPLKMMKNAFLFHHKISFCSQDRLFGHLEKTALLES